MDISIILMMIGAAFLAVAMYTFIGFIPGTDETSVLMPVSLALVLAGFPLPVILSFFMASIVTLNLTNTMPTALVGLPGGVMSSPMIEHAIYIKSQGKSAGIIKKMATASAIGVLISVPISLLLANLLVPFADNIRPYASYLFVFGAIFLSLTSKHKVLSLLSILPLALLFQSIRHLYWGVGIVESNVNITVSFFLGITIGPLIYSLFSLFNKKSYQQMEVDGFNTITIPKDLDKEKSLNMFRIMDKDERRKASIGAVIVNFLFVLSPVGLTLLIGDLFSNRIEDKLKRSTTAIVVMSGVVQATYISGIIIPLFALGIPLSPVALGPGAALFNAPPVLTLDSNMHHLLSRFEFTVAVLIGVGIALVVSYIVINRYAKVITKFILKYISHESVLGLFVAFILLLAFIDAGFINIFGVLLIGIVSGALHKLGVNYGVQFMSLYAAPFLIELLVNLS